MNFATMPIRNLGRRLVRSSLTAVGIAVAVATLISLVGMSRGMERAWSNGMADRGVHMIAVRKGAFELMSSVVNEDVVQKVARVPGVRAAAGELADMLDAGSGVMLVCGWAPGSFLWETLNISKGRLPWKDDTNGVVLGQRVAERLGLGLGDRIPFLGANLEVLALTRQASILNESMMILPLPTMQRLTGKEGRVTGIQMRLSHPEDALEVANLQARLHELFPDLSFLATKEATEANQVIIFFRKMSWIVSWIALFMAFFFIVNTLLMSVNERTKEIGVLSAVGWSRKRIFVMIVIEGMILAFLGSTFGLFAGILSLKWFASLKELQGFTDPEISLRLLFEVFCAAILLGMLGSLYPAWRISRLRVVEALKYE